MKHLHSSANDKKHITISRYTEEGFILLKVKLKAVYSPGKFRTVFLLSIFRARHGPLLSLVEMRLF